MTQAQSEDTPGRPVGERIAGELGVAVRQVSAAVELIDGGATVPFIARRFAGLAPPARVTCASPGSIG